MPNLLQECRRSNLIFIASPGSEAITPDRIRRVREPVSRSKSGVQGKIADVLRGRSRHAESLNELMGFQILMATAHADSWQEQPFTLEYHHRGAKHRYTPDILVSWGIRQEVVEIKEDQDAESPENRERFPLIHELLAEHGYGFRVWKKSEICAEPRLANSILILRYRCTVVAATERERIRRAFSSETEWPLRKLCEVSGVPVQGVLRLVLEGAIHIDWWQPLGLESVTSLAPVGLQVWPAISKEIPCH